MRYSQALRSALEEEMDRDERVFVMGEDVGAFGGVFGVTRGLQAKFGERRVFDTPLAETMIVGAGVGAAITGLRPVVELQFADFVAIAMDEIYNKAAKWRYMHGGQFTVPLVIRAPEGAAGGTGPEHSQCPEGMFWSAMGLYVVTPATPADAKGLLKSAIRDENPVLFLEHKALYNQVGEVPDGEHLVPLGKAVVRRTGGDVTVIAWSRLVPAALAAAEDLAAEGVGVEVLDPRGIRPLDVEAILRSVSKTGRVVLAQESPLLGGAAGEVSALIAEQALTSLLAPVRRVAPPDVPVPQSAAMEELYIPGSASIATAVRSLIAET
jgi:pyruvate dehydrogenase E1 component beta subunit